MRKIITIIGVIGFTTLILCSCGGGGGNAGGSTSIEIDNSTIIALDTCITNSHEITDFLPNKVKKHEDIFAHS